MTTATSSPLLLNLVKEFLFNWFTPERAHFLGCEADSAARLLKLEELPRDFEGDLNPFFWKQLAIKRREFEKNKEDGTCLLDENLRRLCKLLHLSHEEGRTLCYLCLAKAFNELSLLDQISEHNSSRSAAGQIAECLGLPAEVIAPLLNKDSKLIKSGLVDRQRTFSKLTSSMSISFSIVDSEIAYHLIEEPFDFEKITTNLGAMGRPPELTLRDFPHIKPTLEILIPYLEESLKESRTGVNIFIHGIPGTGKTELSRLLGQVLDCGSFEPSFFDEDGDPISGDRRFSRLRCTLSFLKNEPTLIVCDEAEDLFQTSSRENNEPSNHKLWINRLLEENEVPVIWLSNSIRGMDPAIIRRFDFVFELPVPDRKRRQEILTKQAAHLISPHLISQLATHEKLAPAIVSRASGILEKIHDTLSPTSQDQAFTRLVSQTLEAQGHSAPLISNLEDQLPYDPVFNRSSADLAELLQGLHSHPQARICLHGPPGTGKTAFGNWLAESLGLSLQSHRMSDLLSMFVGQTEKAIAKAFQNASAHGAVLMLDEVDSLLASRSNRSQTWQISQVNEMLVQMENFPGILIATTNRMDALDAASLRRFDLKVALDYLASDQLIQIFKATCEKLGLKLTHSPATLRTIHNATPGDFTALIRQHQFYPFKTAQSLVEALLKLCQEKQDQESFPSLGFHAI